MAAKRVVVIGLMLAFGATAWCQRRGSRESAGVAEVAALASSDAEKRILSTLEAARKAGEIYMNVSVSDGRLRVLAEGSGAKNIVEIGTSTGLSGLWLSLALQRKGGRLITFEVDSGRAAAARANFKQAGVDALVTIVEGDAHRTISRLKEPIDVLFIDADKPGYIDYLRKLQPLVRPGGLILAHNVYMAPDYLQAVTTSPQLETVFAGDGQALAITLKKR